MGTSASTLSPSHDPALPLLGVYEILSLLEHDSSFRDTWAIYTANLLHNNLSFLATPFDFTKEYHQNIQLRAQSLLKTYFKDSPSSTRGDSVLQSSFENYSPNSLSIIDIEYLKLIHQSQKELLTVVVIGTITDFLKSKEYLQWFWTHECPINPHSPFQTLFTQFQQHDFDFFIKKSWFETISHTLDNLPIAISISMVDVTRRKFPIIYANLAHQDMSGFDSHEMIGKSIKFIQKGVADATTRGIMTTNLAAGVVGHTSISNRRKNGTVFRSLLFTKPVYALDGTYSLVFAVHFDVSQQHNTYIALCIAHDLFEALPSNCPNDIIDEVKCLLPTS